MQLDADEALRFAAGLIVVDELAHDAAVNELDQYVAARDDVHVVPVFGLDEAFQLIRIARGPDRAGFLTVRNVDDLTAKRQKTATAFFVQDS